MVKSQPTALIRAAGDSSRFEPLANRQNHKAMLTLLGRPILDYVLGDLAKAGFRKVVIVRNADETAMVEYFSHKDHYGLDINFEVQTDLAAGMAGAVLGAKKNLTAPLFFFNPHLFLVNEA